MTMNPRNMLVEALVESVKVARGYAIDANSVEGNPAIAFGILQHATAIFLDEVSDASGAQNEDPGDVESPVLEVEKRRRVYYQDIVYAVCRQLDRMRGRVVSGGIVCGTIEEPSTAVQDEMQRLAEIIRQGKHAMNLLRSIVLSRSVQSTEDAKEFLKNLPS